MVHVQSKYGLKPEFSTMVSVKAYDDEQAKAKAIGKIIEQHFVFRRRRGLNFWIFNVTNLTEIGEQNGKKNS
jgi:hypothetical protein